MRLRAPVRSNSERKNEASRWVIPMAANTMTNVSDSPVTRDCRRTCAAISLPGRPAPENTGSFWPRTRVLNPSMADTPVWMNERGFSREMGLMGTPETGRTWSARTRGKPVPAAAPEPSRILPMRSSETPRRASRSTSEMVVAATSRPMVSSKTWTTVMSSETSMTWPFRGALPGLVIVTVLE